MYLQGYPRNLLCEYMTEFRAVKSFSQSHSSEIHQINNVFTDDFLNSVRSYYEQNVFIVNFADLF